MPHNLTQAVISEHLADGTMTVDDEIALRIDLPPLQDVLYADFDTSVNRIVAQTFLLNAEVDGQARRHIPDFLLIGQPPSKGWPLRLPKP